MSFGLFLTSCIPGRDLFQNHSVLSLILLESFHLVRNKTVRCIKPANCWVDLQNSFQQVVNFFSKYGHNFIVVQVIEMSLEKEKSADAPTLTSGGAEDGLGGCDLGSLSQPSADQSFQPRRFWKACPSPKAVVPGALLPHPWLSSFSFLHSWENAQVWFWGWSQRPTDPKCQWNSFETASRKMLVQAHAVNLTTSTSGWEGPEPSETSETWDLHCMTMTQEWEPIGLSFCLAWTFLTCRQNIPCFVCYLKKIRKELASWWVTR